MTVQQCELIARLVAELIRPEEPYLDKAGIADYLKCSTRTVEFAMRDDGLPYETLFGRSKFKASKVQAWVDSGRGRVGTSLDDSGPGGAGTPPGLDTEG